MRKLVGTGEAITFSEASDMYDMALTEYLFHLRNVVLEATDDEEEQSNILVNLSSKLSNVLTAAEMKGVLMDDADYILSVKSAMPAEIREDVVIELVEDDG